MKSIALTGFIGGCIWLFYVYLGYPLALWVLGLFRHFRPASKNDFLPTISVLISARNEEKDIAWKIAETLNWDYPKDRLELIIGSDASDDRTDEIIQSVDDSRLRFVRMKHRVGKNEALNRLSQVATGEFLFFTDANSHINADCPRKMIRHFADSRVGCVTGTDRTIADEEESSIGVGEKSYFRYETQLQKLESRLGSVLVCFGAIFCIRRPLFTQLGSDLANDLELPIRIGNAGYAVLFEPEAWASEKPTRSPKEEFARRKRICAQGCLGLWRLRKEVRGLRAWQFISRKFLRWTAAVPLFLLVVSSAVLCSDLFFSSLLVLQMAFYSLALGVWVLDGVRRGGRLFALPFYFVLVNIAAFTGLIETCFGQRYGVWEIASLSRGHKSPDCSTL